MIRIALFLLLLIFELSNYENLHAQSYYNKELDFLKANSVWTFGQNAGIDFGSGTPVPFQSQTTVEEGGATIADPLTGDLLFYFDGYSCYDANHQIMPNGGNLFGGGSTTQGACIVPVIDSPGKYYLFSLIGFSNSSYPKPFGTLFYSVVNMSLNNGLGDIEAARKNILLDADSLSESMVAIPGENCDIWLIVHTLVEPKFKAYQITREGIETAPVISITGEQIQGGPLWLKLFGFNVGFAAYGAGAMAVSPDRQMIVISSFAPLCLTGDIGYTGVLLNKFNAQTGQVFNTLQIESNLQSYSAAFSPDNSKLYLANFDYVNDSFNLQQYNVNNYDSIAIANSKIVIGEVPGYENRMSYLKLYNDKIYINEDKKLSALGIIHQPNQMGLACNYQPSSLSLGIFSTMMNLPNEVVFPMKPDTVYRTLMDTLICRGWESGIVLKPGEILKDYNYLWNNSIMDTTLNVHQSGIYSVIYNNGCHFKVDSFILNGGDLLKPIITIDVQQLGTTLSYAAYQWLLNGVPIPGGTENTYSVSQNGDYQVIVTNENGCKDTSEVYEIRNVTTVDYLSRSGGAINIYPNPTDDVLYINSGNSVNIAISTLDGRLIRKEKNVAKISIKNLASGNYFLRITDNEGTLLKVEKITKLR